MSVSNIGGEDRTIYCEFLFPNYIVCSFKVLPVRAKWSKAKYGKILCIQHEKELEVSKK